MEPSKQIDLMCIADLNKPGYAAALKEVTMTARIETLLQDMNLDPFSMKGDLEIGDKERRTGVFSASEVGLTNGHSLCGKYAMGCGRYLYYSYTGVKGEKVWEPRIRRIMDTGTAIHAQLQLYMAACAEAEDFAFQEEVDGDPDQNDYELSAHMDGLAEISVPLINVKFGIEIKTINDAGFKSTRSVHDNHITQCTIYQKLFDLPILLVLYYSKNDSRMAEFILTFDADRWNAIEKKLNMIRHCSLTGTLPPQEVSYECNSCKYKTVCKPPRKATAADARKVFAARPKTVAGKES